MSFFKIMYKVAMSAICNVFIHTTSKGVILATSKKIIATDIINATSFETELITKIFSNKLSNISSKIILWSKANFGNCLQNHFNDAASSPANASGKESNCKVKTQKLCLPWSLLGYYMLNCFNPLKARRFFFQFSNNGVSFSINKSAGQSKITIWSCFRSIKSLYMFSLEQI